VSARIICADAEIAEGLAIIDEVLDIADTYYTGK
jgi:hypothetical protein